MLAVKTTLSAYGYVNVEKMTDRVYFIMEFEGEEQLLFSFHGIVLAATF